MKYIYHIIGHNAEQATLQVKLSCVDIPNVGLVDIPYPHINGIPTFSKAKVLEQVMIHFHADLTNWEMKENNKASYEEIKDEAEAMIGTSVSFDHTILDDGWFENEVE
tara:strand:- start:5977 stop:6300 length:324 start_codon:yes stop_codon:yes gene_type:complete